MTACRHFVVIGALATFAVCAQDRPSAASRSAPTIVKSSLVVEGKSFAMSGPGECTHTDDGSIYEVPAALWSVQQSAENRRLSVTLFRPKSGAEMFTLIVWVGDRTHKVSTVKTASGGAIAGSGAVRVTPTSTGGTFAIDATTDTGARIGGTITCSAFTAPEGNG